MQVMSWKTSSVMEEKERFIKMWESDSYYFNSLCASFGISRTAGYKLIDNYKKYGEAIFEGRSKQPLSTPHKTPQNIEKAIIRLVKE